MLVSRPVKRQLISWLHPIVVWSEVTNAILKAMMEMKAEYRTGDDFEVICIGVSVPDFFRAREVQPVYELRGLPDHPSFGKFIRSFRKQSKCIRAFDELYVCTTTTSTVWRVKCSWNKCFQLLIWTQMRPDEDYVLNLNWNLVEMPSWISIPRICWRSMVHYWC